MPSVAHALTTLARVKARLPNVSATGYDTLLETLINGATDFLEKVCGRRFKETTYTNELYNGYTRDGRRKCSILLKNYPVATLSSIAVTNDGTNWTTLDPTAYQAELDAGIVHFDSELPGGYNNVRVTYTAGFKIDFDNELSATHTLPFDINMACEKLVVREFKKRDAQGMTQQTVASDTVLWTQDIDAEIMRIISKYTKVEIQE